MKTSLSHLPAPVLAGVVREETAAAAIAEIKNCLYDGAGMIDLHISCLNDSSTESLKKIIDASTLPILALNYNRTGAGGCLGSQVALTFATEGISVAICDINAETVKRTVDMVTEAGGVAKGYVADVTESAGIDAAIKQARRQNMSPLPSRRILSLTGC